MINLYCPTLKLSERACATGDVANLHTNRSLPWVGALVVAQLNPSVPR